MARPEWPSAKEIACSLSSPTRRRLEEDGEHVDRVAHSHGQQEGGQDLRGDLDGGVGDGHDRQRAQEREDHDHQRQHHGTGPPEQQEQERRDGGERRLAVKRPMSA